MTSSARFPRACPRPLLTALAAVVAAGALLVGPTTSAFAAPASRNLGKTIEPLAPYQPQTFCDPTEKPGVVAFRDLLLRTYRDSGDYGISRACGAEAGTSEHKDGRAFDWAMKVTDARQKAEVADLFRWLFATDRYGNRYANARRLGVMYIIWDKKIWGAYSATAGWQPYRCSGVTGCHQDHVHFSFGWAGALKKTSYWTGRVSPVVPPPLPVYDDAARRVSVSVPAAATRVYTPFLLRAGHRYRLTAAGTYRYGRSASQVADASCDSRPGVRTWSTRYVREAALGRGVLDLAVEWPTAWRPRFDTGGGCNLHDHTYVMDWTASSTDQLRLEVQDPTHADNSGRLLLYVQRMG